MTDSGFCRCRAIAWSKMTNSQPKRVVSLIASATEIVCALGARDFLVGRSHECDFPPDVAHLPALTEPKFPVTGTSDDIDSRVKAILQEGLSVYRVDAEKLEALRPDIIVTQDHCEVCSVSLKGVEAALFAWGGRRVEIVSLKPNALADIWEDIDKVARALGHEREGERLVEQLKARMASCRPCNAIASSWPTAISISTGPGPASSKVWKSWPRSFTPSYSLLAMKGKVGCITQLSQESRSEDMTTARKKSRSDEGAVLKVGGEAIVSLNL
jgi:ABC-type Fe3+-hydroxamate transport system substrate-binding protein